MVISHQGKILLQDSIDEGDPYNLIFNMLNTCRQNKDENMFKSLLEIKGTSKTETEDFRNRVRNICPDIFIASKDLDFWKMVLKYSDKVYFPNIEKFDLEKDELLPFFENMAAPLQEYKNIEFYVEGQKGEMALLKFLFLVKNSHYIKILYFINAKLKLKYQEFPTIVDLRHYFYIKYQNNKWDMDRYDLQLLMLYAEYYYAAANYRYLLRNLLEFIGEYLTDNIEAHEIILPYVPILGLDSMLESMVEWGGNRYPEKENNRMITFLKKIKLKSELLDYKNEKRSLKWILE